MTPEQRHAIQTIISLGLADQENYLQDGNPHVDYADEWPTVARDKAAKFLRAAEGIRAAGWDTYLAERCEALAASYEASAREYRNPEYGN